MKYSLIVLSAFSVTSAALQAPYLISAVSTIDCTVSVTWRNNDMGSQGFIILRKDSAAVSYRVIDSVKSSVTLTYLDWKDLKPSASYSYRVLAYNNAGISDTSNTLGVTTLLIPTLYLWNASVTDSSIEITWQYDGVSFKGFIIQRKAASNTAYNAIDSFTTISSFTNVTWHGRPVPAFTYVDSWGLQSGISYVYRILSYDTNAALDTSNSISAALSFCNPGKPSIVAAWNFETSTRVHLKISDNSSCESGYYIYRDDGLESKFALIATLVSANPEATGTLEWDDSGTPYNQWCTYKVAAYNKDTSVFSEPCTTFTLHLMPIEKAVQFSKLSDFPIQYGGMSIKSGDSIFLKETSSPAGSYSIINTNDPTRPEFDGFIDRATLLSYPVPTLVPLYVNYEDSSATIQRYKNGVLVMARNGLSGIKMYKFQNDSLIYISKLSAISNGKIYGGIFRFLPLTDSTIADFASYATYGETPYSQYSTTYNYVQAATLVDSGFLLDSAIFSITTSDCNSLSPGYVRKYFLNGFLNSTIIISINGYNSVSYDCSFPMYYRDSSASIAIARGDKQESFSWASPKTHLFRSTNTGCFLSSVEALCTTGSSLFAADLRDLPDGYNTAKSNNAIYTDSIISNLRNIILDTVEKKVYLFSDTRLSILGYERRDSRVDHALNIHSPVKVLRISSNAGSPSVKIFLPEKSGTLPVNIRFFDLTGRLVYKMDNITSNTIVWKPRGRSLACYIITLTRGRERYTAKFMAR
jgi:hypothetical protein